jgi:hypothetical protein
MEGTAGPERTLWRAFPWDPGAAAGTPFSAAYLPAQSGQGRFDLPRTTGGSAWYFAETPEHAVAEKIQDLRNRVLRDDFLFERGRRLAVASAAAGELALADLCDPEQLARYDVAPDHLAYRDRAATQAIAAHLHSTTTLAGFRWWSAFFGEWHTVVLFSDRVGAEALKFRDAEALHVDSPAVVRAAHWLGVEIG